MPRKKKKKKKGQQPPSIRFIEFHPIHTDHLENRAKISTTLDPFPSPLLFTRATQETREENGGIQPPPSSDKLRRPRRWCALSRLVVRRT